MRLATADWPSASVVTQPFEGGAAAGEQLTSSIPFPNLY
jgi:hypothetical protein